MLILTATFALKHCSYHSKWIYPWWLVDVGLWVYFILQYCGILWKRTNFLIISQPKGSKRIMVDSTQIVSQVQIHDIYWVFYHAGDDYVEFSWRISDPYKKYKAILIDVTTNNHTSYAIKQFARSRHSQSGYTISELKVQKTHTINHCCLHSISYYSLC